MAWPGRRETSGNVGCDVYINSIEHLSDKVILFRQSLSRKWTCPSKSDQEGRSRQVRDR